MGHVVVVASGRNHSVHLTRDGDAFTYGSGLYSAVGHGGARSIPSPQVLKPLRDKRIVQVACGEHHSLVVTDKGDVYAWGRGFEGQLGLSRSTQIAATPQYLKAFYGTPVVYVAAGAYYSLAITKDGSVWGWGEAKLGQLGMGKQTRALLPQKVAFSQPEARNFVQCAAGYGHSAALTEEGLLFVWGFNVYGQLGLGNFESQWSPVQVQYYDEYFLPRIQKVMCSHYATFTIDVDGRPYSCGKQPNGQESYEKHEPCLKPI